MFLALSQNKRRSILYSIWKMKVFYSDSDNLESAKSIVLEKGDNFHVYTGLRHQMLALEDTELYEFSTQHFDSDSYRIIKGD